MTPIITLFTESPLILYPRTWTGWLGLVGWLGVIAYCLYRWRRYHKPWVSHSTLTLIILLIFTPLTSLFLGVRLPATEALPLPGASIEITGHALMVFSAVPWVLASGLLGPVPAAALAVLSGLAFANWGTSSIFAVVEMAFLATLLSFALQQRYRTPFFSALRHPLLSTLLVSLIYPILYLVNTVFFSGVSIADQINYAFSHVTLVGLAIGVPIVLAGVIAEVWRMARPQKWGGQPPWEPAPSERKLENRFLWLTIPFLLVLAVIFLARNWMVAEDTAQTILQGQMENAAQIAAEGIPYFLDSGQSLITEHAQELFPLMDSPAEVSTALEDDLRSVPFFHQLYVLDVDGRSLGGYPQTDYYASQTQPEELRGIKLALSGVPVQTYSIPPREGANAAQISFVAAIMDEDQTPRGVLIGRTDMSANPFAKPILSSLQSVESQGGGGYLLDESGRFLFHPDSLQLMRSYEGELAEDGYLGFKTAQDGTRQLIYYQPAVGRPWAVVITIPASKAQAIALNMAAPFSTMIILSSLFVFVIIWANLRRVTVSLKSLAAEANRIAEGRLGDPLPVERLDEVGQLRSAFEEMRKRLKARLDELNQLLQVSRGVAENLDIERAVQPILEAVLTTDGSAARVVLNPDTIPEVAKDATQPLCFGMGTGATAYEVYDHQILELMRSQDRLVLVNPTRTTLLQFGPGLPRPEAVFSAALRHENRYYGALWVAYDSPHTFSNEEVQFLTTLASQAAQAAANAQLFTTVEFGRQRLAAILFSTPDPVIVTDHRDHLLLMNPAAWQALGTSPRQQEGKPVSEVISHPDLVRILSSSTRENESAQVTLPDKRVYYATASSILAEGRHIGRVCVMRDVTRFMELDALKSDFVSTVSHDLRSPLTLLRGYITMLEMVGDLSEEQMGYVRKIMIGIERMSRLVNNLLDLGRIEAGVGLQLDRVSVREVVEQVTGDLQLQVIQKRIQLSVEIPELATPSIEADPSLLYQALYNLVDNAIQYTPEGKKVWVRVRERQDKVVFEVQDTGVGVAPVDQPRLFEKFYRSASRGTRKGSGTGLGLAIVKSIAERHKGRVGFTSQLGKGSTFFIEIPWRQPEQG